MRFENTRAYPIKIVCLAANGILKVQIHGMKEETEYEVDLETKILEETDYKTTYINDNSLNEGQQVVQQYGSNGVKSQTYKILRQNGKEVSRILISTDTYSPLEMVIKKGTKKVSNTTQEKKVENQSTETTKEDNGFNKIVVDDSGEVLSGN